MSLLLLQVCFKQNVHKHNLEFITAQAKLYETVPATFTCADASLLYEDKKKRERLRLQAVSMDASYLDMQHGTANSDFLVDCAGSLCWRVQPCSLWVLLN